MPRAKVSDVEIYYEVAGSGPPLLLLSGWSLADRAFASHIDQLAAKYTCIRLDHRGMGRSDAPDEVYDFKVLGHDARALLHHLGHRTAHVLGGGGMGAQVALELAINHPEVVRSLYLGSPCIRVDNFLKQVMLVWKDLRRLDAELWAREVTLWCFAPVLYEDSPDLPAQSARARAAEDTFPQPYAYDRIVDAYIAHDVSDRLGKIKAPTLVTSGGFDDVITGPRYAREVYARIPGARLIIYEGTSHNYPVEVPEPWGRDVLAWLGEND